MLLHEMDLGPDISVTLSFDGGINSLDIIYSTTAFSLEPLKTIMKTKSRITDIILCDLVNTDRVVGLLDYVKDKLGYPVVFTQTLLYMDCGTKRCTTSFDLKPLDAICVKIDHLEALFS